MKTLLVTGSSGLIGSEVVAYFASRQIDWLSISGGTALLKRAAWLTAIIVASAVCYFAALFVMGFRMRDFRLVSHA